jgi:NAD-dependent DNA ligase
MKIKGLGPASIAKMNLSSIPDIYELTEEQIAEFLNSNKLAEKLIAEIENSKKASLNLLLPAFSIPLIGKTASKKLSTVCENIFDINETTCRQAGLGPKATSNLLDWLENDFYLYASLPFSFEFETTKASSGAKGIVCITGRLKSYKTKATAADFLEKEGYTVKSSLTKDVTILVNESGIESAKTKKARESGVTIVTNINDLMEKK